MWKLNFSAEDYQDNFEYHSWILRYQDTGVYRRLCILCLAAKFDAPIKHATPDTLERWSNRTLSVSEQDILRPDFYRRFLEFAQRSSVFVANSHSGPYTRHGMANTILRRGDLFWASDHRSAINPAHLLVVFRPRADIEQVRSGDEQHVIAS
jgi:hypothetical protein